MDRRRVLVLELFNTKSQDSESLKSGCREVEVQINGGGSDSVTLFRAETVALCLLLESASAL